MIVKNTIRNLLTKTVTKINNNLLQDPKKTKTEKKAKKLLIAFKIKI